MSTTFEWDPNKARQNIQQHSVSFEEATTVFTDLLSITIDEPLHSNTEERYIIIGESSRKRLLVVAHTDRGEYIRIISARIANAYERNNYEESTSI